MGNKLEAVDIYISKREAFAQPILKHLRKAVHKYCPEATESIKWGFPHFGYNGSNLCYMSAFTAHCAFGFWLAQLMKDSHNIFVEKQEGSGMGNLGKISSIKDLPNDEVIGLYIQQAMQLIDAGAKLTKTNKPAVKEIEAPEYFTAALKLHAKAQKHFEQLSLSHKREYIEWITEAKTQATKDKRIATTIEWLSEGKSRNWKYK